MSHRDKILQHEIKSWEIIPTVNPRRKNIIIRINDKDIHFATINAGNAIHLKDFKKGLDMISKIPSIINFIKIELEKSREEDFLYIAKTDLHEKLHS